MLSNTALLALCLALHGISQAPALPPPDDRPITHLVQNLGHDLRAVPSANSALVAGLGAVGALSIHPADAPVATWAAAGGASTYGRVGAVIGDGWTEGSAAVGTYVIGRVVHRPRVAHVGSDLIRAQALDGVLTWGLKLAVPRTRPDGGTNSFPSGHASSAFASAAVLEKAFGWRAGLAAYAAAGFVGWTRVRDRDHWLSDVVAGSAIGTISGRTVTRDARERAWHVAPVVAGRTLALYLVR